MTYASRNNPYAYVEIKSIRELTLPKIFGRTCELIKVSSGVSKDHIFNGLMM